MMTEACQRKRRVKQMARGMTLEERSLTNLTNQIRDELIRIENGEQASKIFTSAFRRTLRRNGVLLRGGAITEDAKKVLGIE